MNISALRTSKYLKKEDFPNPMQLTMSHVEKANMAPDGQKPEMKYLLYFEELEKPMVLNSTNGQLIAQITGSDETDDWKGSKIVLYNEPNVRNPSGMLVGGIRVRAPHVKAKGGTAKDLETEPVEGDPDW